MKQKKSQIYRICFPMRGDRLGVQELFMLEFISKLDRNVFEPHIVTHFEGELTDYLDKQKLNFELIPLSNLIESNRFFVFNIWKVLKSFLPIYVRSLANNYDLVVTHNQRLAITWALPLKAALRKHCLLLTENWEDKRSLGILSGFIRRIWSPFLEIKQSLPSKLKKKYNYAFIGCDKDGGNFRFPDRKELRKNTLLSKADDKQATVIGLIGEDKYIDEVDNLAQEFDTNFKKRLKFVAIGDRNNQHEADFLEHIACINRKNSIEAAKLLAGIDVLFVLGDGFGAFYYIWLALSLGIPVIAEDIGINAELITDEETGVLFINNNINSINDFLQKYVNDKDFAKHISFNISKRFNEEFNLDINIEGVEALFFKEIKARR